MSARIRPDTAPRGGFPLMEGRAARVGSAVRIRGVGVALAMDRPLVTAFVLSRLVVLLAVVAAEYLLARNPLLTSGDAAPLLRSLTSWDGMYYLGIARDGYHAAAVSGAYHDYAFAPLYPMLVRVLSAPWPGFAGLVAVVVSNVAFLAALGLLVRLGEPYLGRRRARLAAMILAFFPFAAVFSMAYTESLFLALSLAAFLAAERGSRSWAGVFLALATLARLQGVVLFVPLGLLILARDGWRPHLSLAWLALGPIAAAGFLAYANGVAGSSTAFLDAQTAWGRAGIGGAAEASGSLAAGFNSPLAVYQGSLLLTLCGALFLLVYVRPDRIPLAYALVPVLYIGAELSSGLLEAVGRITMLAFPYAWILARRSSGFRRSWSLLSVALLALVSALYFAGFYVP